MLNTTSFSDFLNQSMPTSYKTHPTSAQSLYDMVQEDPTIMAWPILVNYKTKQIGHDIAAMRNILNQLVVVRDAILKPPADTADVPLRRMARSPASTAWHDFD
jgi:hypothetical protein